MTMITKFEVGQRYEMRSPCNYDCVWEYTVTKRTEKSVWLMFHTPVAVHRRQLQEQRKVRLGQSPEVDSKACRNTIYELKWEISIDTTKHDLDSHCFIN